MDQFFFSRAACSVALFYSIIYEWIFENLIYAPSMVALWIDLLAHCLPHSTFIHIELRQWCHAYLIFETIQKWITVQINRKLVLYAHWPIDSQLRLRPIETNTHNFSAQKRIKKSSDDEEGKYEIIIKRRTDRIEVMNTWMQSISIDQSQFACSMARESANNQY